eukprot:1099199-Pyramimonas_sp.AAC.1
MADFGGGRGDFHCCEKPGEMVNACEEMLKRSTAPNRGEGKGEGESGAGRAEGSEWGQRRPSQVSPHPWDGKLHVFCNSERLNGSRRLAELVVELTALDWGIAMF